MGTELAQDERIPDDPLMTIEISDPAIGLQGWVCVHGLGKDGSSGGIRCTGDISKKEVQILARAMTYKYAFFGLPQGGAKAGLRIDYDENPERKNRLIRAAAKHLEPIIKRSNIWSPWTDMNFYGDDLAQFYSAIGRCYKPNLQYNSSLRTAISAFWSLEACCDFLGLDPKETRLTLEGFGSVASYLAPLLMRLGVKVVGVSTHRGMVFNSKGLDLFAIAGYRERHGSGWIDQAGDWKRFGCDSLFDIETDIIVPCARVHSITPDKVRRISARLILPIANVPCSEEAINLVDQLGIDYLPDFVVNGGGVCGHIRDNSDPFGVLFKSMIERMFKTARKRNMPIRIVAEDAAHFNYKNLISSTYRPELLHQKVVRKLINNGVVPEKILKKIKNNELKNIYSNLENLFPVPAYM
jgi:glutamate dehydrogenase (NAD(P)+)